ncbi:MAG TPA: anaerobic ribonucleoside-triphosphate reductase activating protein, partial [Spirochaeta sp.]|nr:anaerobic ribonucleoside-triphosphate reductase activating protein [Spirochaeta sp.]
MAEKLYGLNKTTLIDFPGKVASTIFTRGCNLRCPYCHNPDFVSGTDVPDLFTWGEITDYLKKRSHLLGGVCITGGEPLLHDDLPDNISDIHGLGLEVKIDTNGTLPDKLRHLKVDYIAMDIKTSLEDYVRLGFTGDDSELAGRITESIRIVKESGIPHHFRTTVVPGFVSIKVIKDILKLVEGEGTYVLQGFRPGNTLDP